MGKMPCLKGFHGKWLGISWEIWWKMAVSWGFSKWISWEWDGIIHYDMLFSWEDGLSEVKIWFFGYGIIMIIEDYWGGVIATMMTEYERIRMIGPAGNSHVHGKNIENFWKLMSQSMGKMWGSSDIFRFFFRVGQHMGQVKEIQDSHCHQPSPIGYHKSSRVGYGLYWSIADTKKCWRWRQIWKHGNVFNEGGRWKMLLLYGSDWFNQIEMKTRAKIVKTV